MIPAGLPDSLVQVFQKAATDKQAATAADQKVTDLTAQLATAKNDDATALSNAQASLKAATDAADAWWTGTRAALVASVDEPAPASNQQQQTP